MESWYPFVIGAVAFFYIQSFNRIATMYLKNNRQLLWSDFFTKVIPIWGNGDDGDRTHADFSKGS
jgi:hypothetical protein